MECRYVDEFFPFLPRRVVLEKKLSLANWQTNSRFSSFPASFSEMLRYALRSRKLELTTTEPIVVSLSRNSHTTCAILLTCRGKESVLQVFLTEGTEWSRLRIAWQGRWKRMEDFDIRTSSFDSFSDPSPTPASADVVVKERWEWEQRLHAPCSAWRVEILLFVRESLGTASSVPWFYLAIQQ